MAAFELVSGFQPAGQQPEAIEALTRNIQAGARDQVLLGVTGSGKTFVMANVIQALQRPTLILSHNKTLTAQLFSEFRQFFPKNAVEYFVSYYDYYQPEAYLPATDVYIEKDASINEDLDRLRLSATSALLTRPDTIVVASVSCIYGLGAPEEYFRVSQGFQVGQEIVREEVLRGLVRMQYQRNDYEFKRGTFRVRGDALEIWPAYMKRAIRLELFGDEVDEILEIDPLTGEVLMKFDHFAIFPATHFVLDEESGIDRAVQAIEAELEEQLKVLKGANKLLEAQRLESRTRYDLELIQEIGYCQGIENYSRHFDGRQPGQRPACLLDYFPEDWLLIIDESHVTIPQVRGMYNGDRARKMTLVDHGFRLPSALDNRPCTFDEFTRIQPQSVYVSATPAPYEIERSEGAIVELIVRPTGLVDPPVEVRPTTGQVEDILKEIQIRAERNERALITTLTKRLAEDLDQFCRERGVKTMYLHSDIDAIERVEILKDLRTGRYDAVIGVNLLREGLDLPEVSLVVILDADKQGFLRSATSLIQTIGRCARHTDGRVLFYADRMTDAMNKTLEETGRRRQTQLAYNEEHGITPAPVVRGLETGLEEFFGVDADKEIEVPALDHAIGAASSREEEVRLLQQEMVQASADLRFEEAARIRDRLVELGAPIEYVAESAPSYGGGRKRRGTKGGRKGGKKGGARRRGGDG